jgi:hypothetical protein
MVRRSSVDMMQSHVRFYRKFGAGLHLLLSASHRSRILFSTPEAVTRFKQKERNRKQQDDRE